MSIIMIDHKSYTHTHTLISSLICIFTSQFFFLLVGIFTSQYFFFFTPRNYSYNNNISFAHRKYSHNNIYHVIGNIHITIFLIPVGNIYITISFLFIGSIHTKTIFHLLVSNIRITIFIMS